MIAKTLPLLASIGLWVPSLGAAEGITPTRVVGVNTYNNLARAAQIQGRVEIKCEVDKEGSVVRTRVISGHPLLLRMAEENLVQWKFMGSNDPTQHDPREASFVYEFQLGEPTRERPRIEFVFEHPNHIFVKADGSCADHIPCNEAELREYEKSVKKSGRSKKSGLP
jgi:hypothetical protein